MSKNNHRFKDDFRVEIDNLEDLEELEIPKFEKFNTHKKKPEKHRGRKDIKIKEQED